MASNILMQNPKFQNGKYYHILNRGSDKRKIFMDDQDYLRFLISLRLFNSTKEIGSIHNLKLKASDALAKASDAFNFVEIVAYCLIPNHYHLLLKQKQENGISKFMHKIGMGYTNYFNAKQKRSGSLFQGKFKAFEIKTDGKLWETSFYINGNAEIHKIAKADKWPWSSCPDYLNLRKGNLSVKDIILNDFESIKEYKKILFEYIREKKLWKEEIKKYEA